MSFLIVENISKTFIKSNRILEVLKKVNIQISKGTVIGIVGPSGCGKTTLLRIIAGLIKQNEGSVSISTKSPCEYRDSDGIGFVFQKPLLFPWRNLTKNILFPSEIANSNDSTSSKRCVELLDLVGLSGFGDFYPKELSGGMLQRAALARALMNYPNLMLLDEPFNAVDEITREQLWLDFRNIWKEQNLTVILVTHNIQEAIFLSDEVFVMSNHPGSIIYHCKVEIPESRNLDTISDSCFVELYKKIRSNLY